MEKLYWKGRKIKNAVLFKIKAFFHKRRDELESNGYKSKRVNSSYGSMDINVPQDRKSTFEPQIVKKRQKALFQTLHIKSCLRSKIGRIDRWMRYIQSSI